MSNHRMGLVVHESGSVRVNAHRAGKVHAVAPTAADGPVVALCGSVVEVWGNDLFDSGTRTPGGVCSVCAVEHRRTRALAQPPVTG